MPPKAQLDLPLESALGHGGRRAGAGRKPQPGGRRMPHQARPPHAARHPVHVTLRSAHRSLRSRYVFPTVRDAIRDVNRGSFRERRLVRSRRVPGGPAPSIGAVSTSGRKDFRVVHFTVQQDHLHLLVEARDGRALSNGVRALAVTLARRLNQLVFRRGRVFADRWHGRALTTPRAVRHALVYVLGNFRKHAPLAPELLDVFSSAPYFDGFAEFAGCAPIARNPSLVPRALAPPAADAIPIAPATTWLLAVGWLRHGALSVREKPASR